MRLFSGSGSGSLRYSSTSAPRALFGYNYRSTCTAGTCTCDTYQLEYRRYVPSALVLLSMSSPKIRWNKPRCHPSDSETKNVPCARSGHTLSVIGNTGFLFGGLSAGLHDKIARPLNELHILKMGSSEFEWCLLELADGQKPLARWRHSASIYDGTQIIIFGGYYTASLRLSDVWVFDTVAMEWQQPHFDQDPGFIANGSHPASSTWPGLPAPRGGHSATLIGHSMFIFGGYGGHGSIWRLFFLFFAAIYLIASVPQVTQDVTLMIFTALMFERGHGRGLLRRDGAQSGALATNPVRLKHHCSFWGAGMHHNSLMIFS